MSPRLAPLTFLFLAACSVTSTETKPASDATEPAPAAEEGTSDPPAPAEEEEAPAKKPEPPAPTNVAKVVLSGQLANVDLTYGRAGQYIVLDMKGSASVMSTQPSTVAPSKIHVAKTTSYELLYPQQGACDKPPELTIDKGALTLVLQRAGTPNGTISGCYYLAGGVKASDGGFQARLKNVPIDGGGTIGELLVDLAGPKS